MPIETFINSHHATGWEFNGKVQTGRRMIYDLHGRIGELLAKAIDQDALERRDAQGGARRLPPVPPLLRLAGRQGRLPRHGELGLFAVAGGYAHSPKAIDPLTLKEILPSRSAAFPQIFESIIDMQSTDASAGRRHGSHRPCDLRAGEAGGSAERAGHRHPPHRQPVCGSSTGGRRPRPITPSSRCPRTCLNGFRTTSPLRRKRR